MSLIKTSITVPDEILNQAKKISDNFSAVVTEALKDYLMKKRVEKARASFGKWKKREEDSITIVNKLRSEEGRSYARRSN